MNNQSNTPSTQNLVDTAAANGSFKIFGQAVAGARKAVRAMPAVA